MHVDDCTRVRFQTKHCQPGCHHLLVRCLSIVSRASPHRARRRRSRHEHAVRHLVVLPAAMGRIQHHELCASLYPAVIEKKDAGKSKTSCTSLHNDIAITLDHTCERPGTPLKSGSRAAPIKVQPNDRCWLPYRLGRYCCSTGMLLEAVLTAELDLCVQNDSSPLKEPGLVVHRLWII